MTEVVDWGTDPADNADFGDMPMNEGMSPAQLNNSIRAIMAAIKRGVALADLSNVDLEAELAAAGVGGYTTGDVKIAIRTAPQTSWLLCNGQTIGNAASGGTARAHADTADLYALIWAAHDNTAAVIQDSAGTPTVRGADAATDFAANKRIPLPNFCGEFLRGADNGRGVDAGRLLGSAQDADLAAHAHNLGVITVDYALGGVNRGVAHSTPTSFKATENSTGAETRPRNIAVNYFVKL